MMKRCHETCELPTMKPFHELRSLAPTTSAGPIVAAFGGIHDQSPLLPNSGPRLPWRIVIGRELHDARADLLPFFEGVGLERLRAWLDVGQVAAPADAAIADVRAAQVGDHLAVVPEVGVRRALDLVFRRAQLRVELGVEVVLHVEQEGVRPGLRRDVAVLIGIFVHVEGVEVFAAHPVFVTELRHPGVERLRLRQNDDQPPPLFRRPA